MKKCIIFFFCLTTCFAKAQLVDVTPPKKDVELIKQNVLVVILLEEDEKYISEISKGKGVLEAKLYKDRIAAYNQNIQEILPKYFTMYKEVQYKTMTTVFSLPIEERKKMSFLVYNTARELGGFAQPDMQQQKSFRNNKENIAHGTTGTKAPQREWEVVKYNFHNTHERDWGLKEYNDIYKSFRLENEENNYSQLEIYVYDPKGTRGLESKCIYSKLMPKTSISKGELAFFFMQTESIFTDVLNEKKRKYKETVKANNHLLKEKTLIIWKGDLAEKASETGIKKNYSFDFKIVDQEEYDKAIMEKSDKVCYLLIIPMGKFQTVGGGASVTYYHIIVDAITGLLVSYANSAVVLSGTDGFNKVRDKHFEKYIKD